MYVRVCYKNKHRIEVTWNSTLGIYKRCVEDSELLRLITVVARILGTHTSCNWSYKNVNHVILLKKKQKKNILANMKKIFGFDI